MRTKNKKIFTMYLFHPRVQLHHGQCIRLELWRTEWKIVSLKFYRNSWYFDLEHDNKTSRDIQKCYIFRLEDDLLRNRKRKTTPPRWGGGGVIKKKLTITMLHPMYMEVTA